MNKYFVFFILSAKDALKGKEALFGLIFFLGTIMIFYNQLWAAVSMERLLVIKKTNINYIWYSLFSELIILSTPTLHRTLEEDINAGAVAYFVNRPVSFFTMRFAEGIGTLSVNFLFLLVFGMLIAYLLVHEILISSLHLTIIICLCFLSAILNLLIITAVGFCALWIHTTKPIHLLVQNGMFVLGGVILPLTIYPDWLIIISKHTPFYYMFFMVAQLSYNFNWQDVLLILQMDLFWGSIIISLVAFTYHKLYKKINIYGG